MLARESLLVCLDLLRVLTRAGISTHAWEGFLLGIPQVPVLAPRRCFLHLLLSGGVCPYTLSFLHLLLARRSMRGLDPGKGRPHVSLDQVPVPSEASGRLQGQAISELRITRRWWVKANREGWETITAGGESHVALMFAERHEIVNVDVLAKLGHQVARILGTGMEGEETVQVREDLGAQGPALISIHRLHGCQALRRQN